MKEIDVAVLKGSFPDLSGGSVPSIPRNFRTPQELAQMEVYERVLQQVRQVMEPYELGLPQSATGRLATPDGLRKGIVSRRFRRSNWRLPHGNPMEGYFDLAVRFKTKSEDHETAKEVMTLHSDYYHGNLPVSFVQLGTNKNGQIDWVHMILWNQRAIPDPQAKKFLDTLVNDESNKHFILVNPTKEPHLKIHSTVPSTVSMSYMYDAPTQNFVGVQKMPMRAVKSLRRYGGSLAMYKPSLTPEEMVNGIESLMRLIPTV